MCRQTIFNSSFMCFSLNGKKIKIIKGLLKLHSLNLIGILVSVDDNWLISYLKLPAVCVDPLSICISSIERDQPFWTVFSRLPLPDGIGFLRRLN